MHFYATKSQTTCTAYIFGLSSLEPKATTKATLLAIKMKKKQDREEERTKENATTEKTKLRGYFIAASLIDN